jgi:predicted dehydrogenase
LKSKPLNVGLIGFGSIAKKHLAEIIAYKPNANITIRTRQNIAQKDLPKNVKSTPFIEHILSQSFDIVMVATPASEHADYITGLMQCAKRLVIEKPIAATAIDALKIKNAATQIGKPIWIAYNLRYLKNLPMLKKILLSGEIGQVEYVEMIVGQDLKSWRPNRNYRTSVSAQASLGGGVIRELSHELDLAQHLFGNPEESTLKRAKIKYRSLDVEDTAQIKTKFQNGSINSLIKLDFTRKVPKRLITIKGNLGKVEWDLISGELCILKGTKINSVLTQIDDVSTSYHRMWRDLLDSKEPLLPNASDGLKMISWIESMEANSEILTGM